MIVGQAISARYLARKHKDLGWTMAHGFLVVMEGILTPSPRRESSLPTTHDTSETPNERQTHSAEWLSTAPDTEKAQLQDELALLVYSSAGSYDVHEIRIEEIEDKSKSDALAKTLLCLQILWFIL
ncbi:hypothetical protein HGRIS_000932 [Hohenbuehelia grisea]|uniref:Uncharacterized protein n=1 Tax=Hohenbuehelia grisea TaxID=104357 RepID=A0ABR3IQ75_9AGAR